jgi:hypothetical protein
MVGRWIFALLFPAAAAAQHADSLRSAGSIRGTVVDAGSALPLDGATVTLGPSGAFGAFPPQRGSYQVAAARTTVTKDSGLYVFSDLSTGRYRLYVQRLGYEPAAVDVELRGSAAPELSVGLVVVPVRLRAVRIASTLDNPYGRATTATVVEGESRVAAARQRQQQFLGTDVRELTYSDVVEAATMGETDLFRALRRLPGVGGHDDYTTDLWIRGATWNETRTTFDGLPLIDPMHAFGTLSGIGSDAIGAAFLHPGVRPVSLSGDGAALVDLRSRPGGGDGRVRATGEISQVGGRLAFDQRDAGGRYDWTVAARRSFEDVLPSQEWLSGGLSHGQGAHYTEVATRGDVSLGGGRTLQTSGLFTDDYLRSFQSSGGKTALGGWGNAVVKTTLHLPIGGVSVDHYAGLSHFGSREGYASVQVAMSSLPDSTQPAVFDADVTSTDYFTVGGEIRPSGAGDESSWSVGYTWMAQQNHSRITRQRLSWADPFPWPHIANARLEHAAVWAEQRWQLAPRLVADGGVRLDAGGDIGNIASVRPAPTLQLRYAIDGSTLISAGAGRSFQYSQEIPTLPARNNGWSLSIPLLANRETPAIIADQFNAGVEQWRGAGILLTGNAYVRRLDGIALRTLPPAALVEPEIFTPTTVRSYGAEVGLRKLTGRVTGSVAYSYNHATADDGKERFTAAGERRHSLDATVMTRLGGVRLGGALAVTSGVPYTHMQSGALALDNTKGFFWRIEPAAGPQNAQRMPTFESLDLLADWTFHVSGASVTTFFQVQNALDRVNLSWYYGDYCASASVAGVLDRRTKCAGPDLFYSPVARLTSAGIRVAF